MQTFASNNNTHIFFIIHRNPSSGSLAMSETGSLDRMKAAAERRKKGLDDSGPTVSGRVEGTRVNPETFIDEILKNTKLDQLEESAESKSNLNSEIRKRQKTINFICFFFFYNMQQLDYSYLLQEMAPLH